MYRRHAAEELAKFLGIISHPDRILIIEELNIGELDVTELQERLKLSQSATSRHLSLLKAQHIVVERKQGRRVFYHLSVPDLSSWLIDGLDIIDEKDQTSLSLDKTIKAAKKLWANSRNT